MTYLDIEDEANKFLDKYYPSGIPPVPVDEIAEFDLGLSIVTKKGLFQAEAIDAYLTSDLAELHIDEDYYMDQTNRGRFTIAHEIGHYVLHQEHVRKATSVREWKKAILGEGTGRAYLETEADSFAGCILMPRGLVVKEFNEQKTKAKNLFKKSNMKMPDDDSLLPFIANKVCIPFQVSSIAAQFRLERIFKIPRM
ncbi:MAG: ImmA/IrrE family metallo-endopeptidase [Pseudomonadota bacterium]|nr:ImmA/IrrE family metallo-endopeptidase [Pseudomonadota bacterium]